MRSRLIIEYSTDESPDCIGGVHDSIYEIISKSLPYMVDNVAIDYEEIDEDEE